MTHSRLGRPFVALASLMLLAAALVAPGTAGAADPPAANLVLRRVDASKATSLQAVFSYDGDIKDVAGTQAKLSGKKLDGIKAVPSAEIGAPVGLAVVIDSSGSTDDSGVLSEARKAVNAMMAKVPKGTEVGIVAAGRDASRVQRLTTSAADVTTGLATITPFGDGALYEGIARATALFEGRPDLIPEILVITDGNKATGVDTKAEIAVGNAAAIGAEIHVLAVTSDALDGGPHGVADATGGVYSEVTKASDIANGLLPITKRVNGTYGFKLDTVTPDGVNDLDLTVGGVSRTNSFVNGAVTTGAAGLVYQTTTRDTGLFEPLANGTGMALGVLLALVAAALAAWALLNVFVRDDNGLTKMLRPYDGYQPESDEDAPVEGMATTPLMQRAVELTHQFAERQGFLTKVEGALERANLPLRAAEALFFYAAGSVVFAALVFALTGSFLIGLVALVLAGLLAPTMINFVAKRRKKKFEAMLPDMLQLLSGTLRAGYSMMQGVEAVSQEVDEPMGRELRRVVTEARLGRPLEDALEAVADRMGSNDFRWATMAIRIQREVGGNLSELLLTVAETMTHRERLKRDVNTLTAEGRVSAYVLGCLPPGLGVTMTVLNPDYTAKLFDNSLGIGMLVASGLLMAAGFMWMLKIIKIDI